MNDPFSVSLAHMLELELVHSFIFRRQPLPLMWPSWSSNSQSVQRCLSWRWHVLMAFARGTTPFSPKLKRTLPAVTLEVSVVVVVTLVAVVVVVTLVAVVVVVALVVVVLVAATVLAWQPLPAESTVKVAEAFHVTRPNLPDENEPSLTELINAPSL